MDTIKLHFPTVTLPARTAPGAICEKSPIMHSCSTTEEVLSITPVPISARALTDTLRAIKVPVPVWAEEDTRALGSMMVRQAPHALYVWKTLSLILLSPILINQFRFFSSSADSSPR